MMRQGIKRLLKLFAALVLLMAVFLAGTLAGLRIKPVQQRLIAEVNKLIPGEISLETFQISLIPGKVTLKGVTITGPDREMILEAQRLFVDIEWTALAKRALTVDVLDVEKPRIHIRMNDRGEVNLIQAFVAAGEEADEPEIEKESEDGEFPFNIVLKKLDISQGFVRYEMTPNRVLAELQNIDLQAYADLKRLDGQFALKAPKGALHVQSIQTDLDGIDLGLILKKGAADLGFSVGIAAGILQMKAEAGLKEAFYQGFLSSQRNLEALTYKTKLGIENIHLEKLLRGEPAPVGRVDTQLLVAGKGISLQRMAIETDLALSVRQCSVDKAVAPLNLVMKMAGRLKEGEASLLALEAETTGLSLNARGRYKLSDSAVAAHLAIHAPELNTSLSAFGIQNVRGATQLVLDVTGSTKQPVAHLTLQGDRLQYEKINIGNLRLRASLDEGGELNLSDLFLENQGSVLKARGRAGLFKEAFQFNPDLPVILSLSLQEAEIKDFLSNVPASGLLAGKLNLQGELKALNGELSLQGKGFQTDFARIGDFTAQVGLSQGKLILKKMALRNQESRLYASGNARIFDPEKAAFIKNPAFEITLEAAPLYLNHFLDNYQGEVALDARIGGNLKQPRGAIALTGKQIDLGLQKLDSIELKAELAKERVSLAALEIDVASGEKIEGSGWISLNRTFDLSLHSKGISFEHIDQLQQASVATGMVGLDIVGSGSFENPRLKGDVFFKKIKIHGESFEDYQLNIDLKDYLAQVSGNIGFNLVGKYHLKDKSFSAAAKFADTELAPYFLIAGGTRLSGNLTGTIEISGNSDALEKGKGLAVLDSYSLYFDGKPLVYGQNGKLFYQAEALSIPFLKATLLRRGNIEVRGEAPLKGPLDLTVKGDIPFELVSLVLEDLPNAGGDLVFQADVSGSISEPDFQAEIELKEVGLTVPELMQKLHGLNGRIEITPQKVTLSKLRGYLDAGRFDFDGQIELAAYRPVKGSVNFKAKALPVQIPEMLDILMNVDIKLEGTQEKALINGRFVLLDGLYYKNMNLSPFLFVPKKKRTMAPTPKEIQDPFLKNLAFDISVKSRDPFLVENNLAVLELRPDLELKGTLTRPVLSGRAKVESGLIRYQKKEFIVKKGVLDFLNPYKIEPTMDIESEAKVRQWLITLKASGTPDQLSFALSSEPKEEDQDILSLLFVGKTMRELIAGEGGPAKSTEQLLAEIIASTFGEDIKRHTGLDVFEVETREEDNDEESDRIKVTVGKKLSKRMTLKYSVETKEGEVIQRTSSDYKLMENFLVSGFQDTKGDFGGELLYRLEFR